MGDRRIGGIIIFKVDGNQFQAKGAFTYNLGVPKKSSVVGHDGGHGYKELPQPSSCEGLITDSSDISIRDIRRLRDVTVTLALANGKTIVLTEAVETSDGDVTTEEGEAQIRFESPNEATELPAA